MANDDHRPMTMSVAEEWRQVVGYEGLYEVSSHGRVRSLLAAAPRLLSLAYSTDGGYPVVSLHRSGAQSTRKVHLLMAAAFFPPPMEGQEVRHLDGNPRNNMITNLRYGSHGANMLDAVAHGTHNNARKTHCKRGHEFTAANTQLKGTWRSCRACGNAERRARRAACRAA